MKIKAVFGPVLNYIKRTDKWLLVFCAAASFFSCLLISGIAHGGNASWQSFYVQAGASVIGVAAAVLISQTDYHGLAAIWKWHMPIILFVVMLTFFVGLERGGNQAWLPLPFGATLQPTEFLKISFILTFSLHLSKVGRNINKLPELGLLLLHGLAPVLLIHFLQHDDGTAIVFAAIFIVMLFSAELSWKYILSGIASLAVVLPVLFFFILTDKQKMRILAVFVPNMDPDTVWQQNLGLTSLGSGKVFGRGIWSGTHLYIPEMHNDFIFAFTGEALGLIGCLIVVTVIAAVAVKILMTSRYSADHLGRYVCMGVFAMIAFQAFINIGMCLGLLPVIGVTLPLFSAGGSSVLATYMGIGLVMSVYLHSAPGLLLGKK